MVAGNVADAVTALSEGTDMATADITSVADIIDDDVPF
jgi:hypothetical protein